MSLSTADGSAVTLILENKIRLGSVGQHQLLEEYSGLVADLEQSGILGDRINTRFTLRLSQRFLTLGFSQDSCCESPSSSPFSSSRSVSFVLRLFSPRFFQSL